MAFSSKVPSLSILNRVLGDWDSAKGYLKKDLQAIQKWARSLPQPPTHLTPRVVSMQSSAMPAINVSTTDVFELLQQATPILSFTSALQGTPVDGQSLTIRILDNGTPQAITWGAKFVSNGATLPTTTIANTVMYVLCQYNAAQGLWECLSVGNGSGSAPGQALTRTNDTNVTATLTGTPASALLQAVNIALGWTGLLGLARGGTNVDLSASGATHAVLAQNASHVISARVLDGSDIGNGIITQDFRDLQVRTHPDADKASLQVSVLRLTQATMSDGYQYNGLTLPLTANITVSGAGGLDTGSQTASTWYSLHLIGKSSTKNVADLALLLHRELDNSGDQSQLTNSTQVGLNNSSAHALIGIPFTPSVTGIRPYMDLQLQGNGTPTGNVRVQIQTDNSGAPSGSVLATSDALNMTNLNTVAGGTRLRFIFRSPVSLTSGTKYWYVLVPSYATNASNFVGCSVVLSGSGLSYYNGSSWSVLGTTSAWFVDFVQQHNAALTFPAGYDESCKLTYVYNQSGNVLSPFIALNKKIIFGDTTNSALATALTGTTPQFISIVQCVPPIPVTLLGWVGNATTGDWAVMGTVPDGYQGISPIYPAFIQRIIDPGTAGNIDAPNVFLPVETQAVYCSVNAGSGYFYRSGFEW